LSANGEQIKAAEAHVVEYVRRHPWASLELRSRPDSLSAVCSVR
jgi:hypothetical protein